MLNFKYRNNRGDKLNSKLLGKFLKNNNNIKSFNTAESLHDFTTILNELRNPLKKDNYVKFFYRGEDQRYVSPNVASIYRYNYPESKLYHSYMIRFKYFRDMHNFSKLEYMEHYGLPTCLLDITSEPLVSLYFACCNTYGLDRNWVGDEYIHLKLRKYYNCKNNDISLSKKYYGVVHLIALNNRDTIYDNNYSDIAEILATFALLKNSTQQKIFNDIKSINKPISKNINIYKLFYHFLKNHMMNDTYFPEIVQRLVVLSKHNFYNLRDCFESFKEIKRKYMRLMFHSYEMINFTHKIRQDMSDFIPMLNVFRFLSPKIIQPTFNNKRIKAQRGLFIFENYPSYDKSINSNTTKGKSSIKKRMKRISNDINDRFHIINIFIPNNKKKQILHDLNLYYGINSSTLFPNLANTAQYLRNNLP